MNSSNTKTLPTPFKDAVQRAHRRSGDGIPFDPTDELGALCSLVGVCLTVLGADEPDPFDVVEAAEVLGEVQSRLRVLRDVIGDVAIEVDADDEKRADIARADASRGLQ